MKGNSCVAALCVAVGASVFASPAYAGAFYLQEQSPIEVGRAFSGAAAAGDDASVVYYNPAAMTELRGLTVTAGGSLLFVDARQQNQNSTRTTPGSPTQYPIPGGDGGNPFASVVGVPSIYAVGQVNDRLSLGLGVNAPFGLKLDYNPDFFGRYDSLGTDLKTYNIGASAGYKVTDHLSVGGGVDVQYVKVTLTNAIPNLSPLDTDGFGRVHGDDWSVGWNLGVFYKTDGGVKLGASYRSGIRHKVSGVYAVSGLHGPLAAGNVTLPATAPLDLPDIWTLSVNAPVGAKARVYLTGHYYNWSVFKGIDVQPQGAAAVVTPLNYKDSVGVSLGGEYDVSPKLTLRAGTMFDQTPTNADFLTTRVPDGDRYWLTTGASYHLSPKLTVNVAYAHTFVDKAHIDRADEFFPAPATVTATTRAITRGNADQIAFSLTAKL